MTKQKTPQTQSEENARPEQSDLEADQSLPSEDDPAYSRMEGAETGSNRSARRIPTTTQHHDTEPETVAHEGSLSTRTPKKPSQGITSHTAEEESTRQEKVVNDRPDAQAGVNHSK